MNPDPDSAQWNARDVVANLCFVVLANSYVIQLKNAYKSPQMIAVCKDFGIVALAVTIGGTMYAAQRLARGTYGHSGEPKSRGRWESRGLKWTFNTVRASTCVSGLAFCSFLLTNRDYTWWSGDLLRLIVGASVVGLPALLCLCILSTHASLYFSCSSYYAAAKDPAAMSLLDARH